MCILTMKSMTHALRAKNVLASRGIVVDVVNLDPKLTEKGCGYGIRFPCGEAAAVQGILAAREVPFGVLMGNREGEGK